MKTRQTIGTVLAGLLLASAALGQATTQPSQRGGGDGRPAPAIDRVPPDLDAWWQHAVFYEVFVRSFADSTSGPLAGDGIGDLRGLIEKLDYLNDGDPDTDDDLGITGLWLMPVAESPSYHGYDTTDYRKIEPDYGTNEDFLALIEACRARGIRVTIDLVLNHSSSQHAWFRRAAAGDPAYRDWFIWRERDPGYRGPWGQQVWHPGPGGGFYYGVFWGGMPDLDYENPAVSAEMLDVVRFWLEELRVDGFRLDAIRHLIEDGPVQDNTPATHAWLRTYFEHVKSINPEAVSVGEVWASSDEISRYVGGQMDLAFEFSLSDATIGSVRSGESGPLRRAIARVNELYPTGMYATFLRNHDQPRVMHELDSDVRAAGLAAAIQFALPGVPYIYYGEEIGMRAGKPDPRLRTPMQWTLGRNFGFSRVRPWAEPLDDVRTANVAVQTRDRGSLLSLYRRLIRVRMANETLRTGRVVLADASDGRVLAFTRELEGEPPVLCVFNLSGEAVRGVTVRSGSIERGTRLGDDLLSGVPGGRFGTRPLRLAARAMHYFPVETE